MQKRNPRFGCSSLLGCRWRRFGWSAGGRREASPFTWSAGLHLRRKKGIENQLFSGFYLEQIDCFFIIVRFVFLPGLMQSLQCKACGVGRTDWLVGASSTVRSSLVNKISKIRCQTIWSLYGWSIEHSQVVSRWWRIRSQKLNIKNQTISSLAGSIIEHSQVLSYFRLKNYIISIANGKTFSTVLKMQKPKTMAVDKTCDLQEARVSVVSVKSPGELQLVVVVFFRCM